MVSGNFLLEPREPAPGETLTALGAAIGELEEKLVERVVGTDILAELELWREVNDSLFEGASEEELDTLRFFDNIHGKPDKKDDPFRKALHIKRSIRDMATAALVLPTNLEETHLIPEFTSKFIFYGDIVFDGEVYLDGEVAFFSRDYDMPQGEIMVGIGTQGASMRKLLSVIFGSEDPDRNYEPYDIAIMQIQDSPFRTEELLEFLSSLKVEYDRLLGLPSSELIGLVMSFRESQDNN